MKSEILLCVLRLIFLISSDFRVRILSVGVFRFFIVYVKSDAPLLTGLILAGTCN